MYVDVVIHRDTALAAIDIKKKMVMVKAKTTLTGAVKKFKCNDHYFEI